VTQEITRLDGVTAVEIDLVPGGDSRVTVSVTAPLAEDAVRTAVQEAGYDLAGVH
jgi:copper chaperone